LEVDANLKATSVASIPKAFDSIANFIITNEALLYIIRKIVKILNVI